VIRFTCPECHRVLEVDDDDAGLTMTCPTCGERLEVPSHHKAAQDKLGRRDDDEDEDDNDRPRKKRRSERRCSECGATLHKTDRYCPECDARQPERRDAALDEAHSKKVAAGVCGILLGGFGVHKFILGFTTPGVIMLLVSLLTCCIAFKVMWIIGIVEGITYLTKSDEEFYEIYMVGKKEWF
jgi:TM2 domain-containing membrane protein YozV